ncbi:MAG: DUF3108 domain-containing protein [Betaproteobacteria bacterium]
MDWSIDRFGSSLHHDQMVQFVRSGKQNIPRREHGSGTSYKMGLKLVLSLSRMEFLRTDQYRLTLTRSSDTLMSMTNFVGDKFLRVSYTLASCLLSLGLVLVSGAFSAEEQPIASPLQHIHAFRPGETLTYDISWSNIVTAGVAVMEVKQETTPDGREVLRFIVSSHSTGIVNKFYSLGDTVQSVFDPQSMQSLSFSLRESHGKKTRRRELVFDHAQRTVVSRLNDDPPETLTIPDPVQDSLSAIYYLRTRDDFTASKPVTMNVFDSDKSWSVEVQILGRNKVKTPAGEFTTIKVRAYKGLFMSEGEIFLWLTDDSRKVPVLIKSTIKIGSLVFTLTGMKQGDEAH